MKKEKIQHVSHLDGDQSASSILLRFSCTVLEDWMRSADVWILTHGSCRRCLFADLLPQAALLGSLFTVTFCNAYCTCAKMTAQGN